MNFDKLNEADVREEIIAPLIRELGYRSDSTNNVLRELPLRYPLIFFGRKDKKKDQTLRGKADYVLEAARLVRWVIEAKSPAAAISQDDIEQAYTYANHAEVRAIYFILCNGRELIAFQTNLGPNVAPLLKVTYEEMMSEQGRGTLNNLLSPDSILRSHKMQEVDVGVPIGPRLRSFVQISGGFIAYTETVPGIPVLLAMQIAVIGGSVQRAEDGSLIALIESRAPIRTIDDFLKKNKLTTIELRSQEKALSVDKAHPTIFRCKTGTTFAAGDVLCNVETWEDFVLPFNLHMEIDFEAKVVLEGERLCGAIMLISKMDGKIILEGKGNVCVNLS